MSRPYSEITFEEKEQILREYYDKEYKAHDIFKNHSISQASMQKVILELGGELRRPSSQGNRNKDKGIKKCNKCGRKIEIKGAKFCPFCANDLRTEKELLVEDLENLTKLFNSIPETQRDFFINTINKAKYYILKEKK